MENKVKIQEVLGAITKNLECSICLDLLNNPVSTKCDHYFCRFCILEFLEKKRSVPCPLCKASITKRSLNDRPQLNSMVDGVRKLISAFQDDTGAIFSPPRGPHVMNLTPCTPEPIPCKAPRGTKRKIMISPKDTQPKQNFRQSKRRKSLGMTSTAQAANDKEELLKYLDQGSCGGENRATDEGKDLADTSTSVGTGMAKNDTRDTKLGKRTSRRSLQHTDGGKDLNNKNKVPSEVSVKKACFTLGSTKTEDSTKTLNGKDYSFRNTKVVSYREEDSENVDSSPVSMKDSYSFNDSPVTHVHVMQERGMSKMRRPPQPKCHDQDSSGEITTANDKGQTTLVNEMSQGDNSVKDSGMNISSQGKDSIHSVEFKPKEKTVFEKVEKTYRRQKNKPSAVQVIKKVNSWLDSNVTDDNVRGDNVTDDNLRGDNSRFMEDIRQESIDAGENVEIEADIEGQMEDTSDGQENQAESISQKRNQCNDKNYGNKENVLLSHKNQFQENFALPTGPENSLHSLSHKNQTKEKVVAEPENDIALSKVLDKLQPVATNKRKIFKTKQTAQTTSVCQKKGVLVIKKVSPTGANQSISKLSKKNDCMDKLKVDPKPLTDADPDPYEFKSSQKTPTIPDSKKSLKKKVKDSLKGKLDFKTCERLKSDKVSCIEETQDSDGEIGLEVNDGGHSEKTTGEVSVAEDRGNSESDLGNQIKDKDNGDMKIKQNCKEKTIIVAYGESSNQNYMTKNPILKKKYNENVAMVTAEEDNLHEEEADLKNTGADNSQMSIIPGSNESLQPGCKKNKKISKMATKANRMKEVEMNNVKDMQKQKENINSAEDFDLILCTQDAVNTMGKDTSQDSVIPDTAESLCSKRKKSVSFADINVEISGTPRQTRRSVPMLLDRNRGKLLPKDVVSNVQAGGPTDVQSVNSALQCHQVPTEQVKVKMQPVTKVQKMEAKQKATKQQKIGKIKEVARGKGMGAKPKSQKEEKKPFAWDDEDVDSDGTEDLDINPSQDEFEDPSQDIESKATEMKQQDINRNGNSKMNDISNKAKNIQEINPTVIQSTLLNNLSNIDINIDQDKNVLPEVYVENTQEKLEDHCINDSEIQTVPESVEDIIQIEEGEVLQDMDGGKPNDADKKSKCKVSFNNNVNTEVKNSIYESKRSGFGQKQVMRENKCEVDQSPSITQTMHTNASDTQSTVSTIEDSDISQPLRKRRVKQRSRKTASQSSTCMSNGSKTGASVIEGTQDKETSNKSYLKSFSNKAKINKDMSTMSGDKPVPSVRTEKSECDEIASDTTSQDSVSILLPIETRSPKVDGSNQGLDLVAKNSKINNVETNESLETQTPLRNRTEGHSEITHEAYDSDIELVSQHDINADQSTPIVISVTEICQSINHQEKESQPVGTSSKGQRDSCSDVVPNTVESEMGSLVSQDQLTATLVSQRTLNLRNSAEKKRRSAERQLQQERSHVSRKAVLMGESVDQEGLQGSPEDIFMMDSEALIAESQSIPQNPEGIVCMDIEPSRTPNPCFIDTERTELEEDSSQMEIDTKDVGGEEGNKAAKCIDDGLKQSLSKEQDSLMHDEVDGFGNLSPHKLRSMSNQVNGNNKASLSEVKSTSRKRALRGLARKGKNSHSDNGLGSSDLNESVSSSKSLSGTKAKSTYKPCSIVDRLVKDSVTRGDNSPDFQAKGDNSSCKKSHITDIAAGSSQKSEINKTDSHLTPRKRKDLKGEKISPTFAFSPRKTKSKPTENNEQKSIQQMSEVKVQEVQGSKDVDVIGDTESDTELPAVVPNKFKSLLKDDIADTEMSEDETMETMEPMIEERLNFSNIEDNDDEVREVTHKSSKSFKEINFSEQLFNDTDNGRQHEVVVCDDISCSLPEVNDDDVDDTDATSIDKGVYSQFRKSNRSQSQDKRKEKKWNSFMKKRQECSQHRLRNQKDQDVIDLETCSKEDQPIVDLEPCSEDEAKCHKDQSVVELEPCDKPETISMKDQYAVDLEPSSPLPDLIGDHGEDINGQAVVDSDDEDAVLIRSDGIHNIGEPEDDLDTVDPGNHGDNPGDNLILLNHGNHGDSSDENDDIITVKKKRKRVIDEESDLSDGSADSFNSRKFDNTSSSAFSSQSEPINTQQRNKLENDLERMKREMKEIELQLALANQTNQGCTPREKRRSSTEAVDTINLDGPDSPQSDVIHEYQSEEELFNSPPPLSPPPMSPQNIDLDLETGKTNIVHNLEIKTNPNNTHEKSLKPTSESSQSIATPHNCRKKVKDTVQLGSSKVNSQQSTVVQSSPRLSPIMERKRQKILSPMNNSAKDTRKIQKVFVSTGLVAPQMKELQKLAVLNQCQFTTKFTKDVTHVIVKTEPLGSRICDRTLKVFLGIAQKCWILDYQWVIDSRSAGHLLPEADYEIQGDTVTEQLHFGPQRARESISDPLFSGLQFIVVGNSHGLQRDDLKNLLKSCGGIIISRMDELNDEEFAMVITCSDYDDSQEDDPSPNELQKFKEIYDRHGIIAASREWVLDSLTVYKVQPLLDYILTPGSINRKDIPVFDKG